MSTFNVEGMSCKNCARTIENLIHEKDPAALVRVDLEAHKVSVDSTLGDELISSLLEEEGYQVISKT